ncbi:sensor histidine kinase [Conyzicola nivalis]|uniref:histidine kinase n=1 Tax=Conyzicola nivalis TaxID=1477021 RepID=A0A916SG90_9MICO|nr:HAMP domain-containing sensor histidine kinase [Conyzicola nivalis]GGA95953.1 two-component sensor histidine kinase [Conyzicola nivalis]
MDRSRAPQDPVRSSRISRSIVNSQLLISAALLLFAVVVFAIQPAAFQEPLFFSSLLLVFILTGVALLTDWTPRRKRWAALLPVLDIFAIVGIREAEPQLGAGLLLVLPVIWLARNYGFAGAVGGATLATVAIWGVWPFRGVPISISDFAGLILLPLTFAFIATTTYATSRRSQSQRALLRQQSALVESALVRARKQERLLEEVLNAVEFGVIAFDDRGRATLRNNAHEHSLREFGAPHSAIIHPVIYEPDGTTRYEEAERPYARALAGEEFENLVFWVGSPGEARAAYSATSRQTRNIDGEPDGGVVVVRDVTVELEAVRARENLAASVSHELRTPLTSIIGFLELAVDAPELTSETRRMLDIAARNSERMLGLVTDLLQTASDKDGSLTLAISSCDVAELARQAVESSGLAAEQRGLTVVTSIDRPAVINADPFRIRQVLDNLLSNAVKYNRTGGSITVSVDAADDAVRIDVTDTGVGVSEADQAHLFDRFFRAGSARRSDVVGTGLGLGISRDIAKLHGGSLSVTSEVGVGSTFSLVLPVTTQEAA